MSSARSPGDKPEADPPASDPASPGRYSLSTGGSSELAAVRIDSTRLLAVRPESAAASPTPKADADAPPSSARRPPPVRLPSAVAPRGAAPAKASAVAPPSARSTAPRAPGAKPAAPNAPVPRAPPVAAAPKAAPVAAEPPPNRNSSLRPPPPSKRDSALPPPPETFEGFDEGSIAHAFDELLSEGTSGVAGRDAHVDLAPVRELFAELAANHMRHVRDFMIDVKWGEAPREWIEICVPAVASLRRAAERLDLAELASGLERFAGELRATAAESGRSIAGAPKERLLTTYEELVTILPQAFALDRDKSQREAVIIQSLCLSVPDVRKVTIDKLHAAGLTSLSTLFDAKPDEVAQVAGIPEPLALRIVERFQAYRRELQNASPQDARAAERDRLATLTLALRQHHDGYEEAARAWSAEAKGKKRDLFRLREETWLAISLLLARFGEVERIQGIERVPFAQRIEQLTDYLEEARQKYRSE